MSTINKITMNNTQNITKFNPEKTLKITNIKRICSNYSEKCENLSSASTKDSFSSLKTKNFRISSSTKKPNQEQEKLVKSAVTSIFNTKSNNSSPIKKISFSILKNKTIELTKKRDTPKKFVIRSDERKNCTTPSSPLSKLNIFDSDSESEISLEENDCSFLSEDDLESTELSFITQINDNFCSSLNTSQILNF